MIETLEKFNYVLTERESFFVRTFDHEFPQCYSALQTSKPETEINNTMLKIL